MLDLAQVRSPMSPKLTQVGNEHGLMMVPSPRPQRLFENPAAGNMVAAQQNGGTGPDRDQPLIARYGALLPKYYKFLEQLPPDALPVAPPASKHLYHITRGRISMTVMLKTNTIIVNHPHKDHVDYRIQARQIGGPAAAWIRGKAIAIAWAAAPRGWPRAWA